MAAISRSAAAVVLLAASLAGAHRSLPPGVTCGSQFGSAATALEVPNPAISWASYRILTCDAPVFWLKAQDMAANQNIFFTVVAPVIERFSDVRVHVLLIGPGLSQLSAEDQAKVPADVLASIPSGQGAMLFESPEDQSTCGHLDSAMMGGASDVMDSRCRFHEPYGDTHSWVLLDRFLAAPAAGTYHFAVFSNGKPAKLSFACCDWPEDFTTAFPMPDAECPYCGTMANFSEYSSHFYETKSMTQYGGFPAAEVCTNESIAKVPDAVTQCPPAPSPYDAQIPQNESCMLHCAGEECHSHNIFGECTYALQWITPRATINGANVTSLNLFKGDKVLFTSAGHMWPHNLVTMESESKLEACDFSGKTQILSVEEVRSGTVVPFDTAGTFYYSCEMTGHCALGQKLTVQVKDSSQGMRCHAHSTCPDGQIVAHVLGNSEYGAEAGQCTEMCTPLAGLGWIAGGVQGTCISAGYSVMVAEKSVQPAGSPMAMSVVVMAKLAGDHDDDDGHGHGHEHGGDDDGHDNPSPAPTASSPAPTASSLAPTASASGGDITCAGGEVAAYIAGSEEGSENYGVTADQCAEFCTMAAGLAWMPGVAEGLCSSAGYSVLVDQISVTPQGSPMALQVNVKKMPDRRRLDSTATGVCHCHSYEEIKCDAAGDALYDEHIVELQTYCQGVVDGTDLTCPFKCFQPWEVMHLYYMECDTRPVHSLFTQIEETGKCHMASASPSGDSACMMDSSTEKDGATTTTQLGDASVALAAAGYFRGFQSLGLAMVAGSLLISAY